MNTDKQIASALGVLELGRQMFTREATRSGNDNTLWETMGSCIRGLTRRFALDERRPFEVTVAELHNVWFIFTLAISHVDADHPAQDRLIRIILWAREIGVLTMADGDKVITPDGRPWVDLPFLVGDVKAAWEKAIAVSPTDTDSRAAIKACNLAAGIAKLAGLGVCDEAFTGCGVDVMRMVLEEKEVMGFNTLQSLALVEVWLRYGGDKLFLLCAKDDGFEKRWTCSGEIPLGSLVRDTGLRTEGLSRRRVLFWQQQLLKLKMHEDEGIGAAAQRCANMIEWCCTCLNGKEIEAWANAENFDI